MLETTNHLLFLRFYNNGYFKGIPGQMFPMPFSFLVRCKFETTGWRLYVFEFGKKTLQTCSGKHFLLLKKIQ